MTMLVPSRRLDIATHLIRVGGIYMKPTPPGILRAMGGEAPRRRGPVIRGVLPEDPDDPSNASWGEISLTPVGALLLFAIHEAIPRDWSFWLTGAVYLGLGLLVGLALRLWARRSA